MYPEVEEYLETGLRKPCLEGKSRAIHAVYTGIERKIIGIAMGGIGMDQA